MTKQRRSGIQQTSKVSDFCRRQPRFPGPPPQGQALNGDGRSWHPGWGANVLAPALPAQSGLQKQNK